MRGAISCFLSSRGRGFSHQYYVVTNNVLKDFVSNRRREHVTYSWHGRRGGRINMSPDNNAWWCHLAHCHGTLYTFFNIHLWETFRKEHNAIIEFTRQQCTPDLAEDRDTSK